MSAQPGLEFLAELVAADRALSAALAELDELARETARLHERAQTLSELFRSAPAERERLAAALGSAEAEAAARAETFARAEAELAVAETRGDKERLVAARRTHVQAGDALAMAAKRVEALRGEAAGFERHVGDAEGEAPEIEAKAASVAALLRQLPWLASEAGRPPETDLAGVAAWATGARAALLVARSGRAAERDAIVRQANELASSMVGESLVATSAEAIARRVQANPG